MSKNQGSFGFGVSAHLAGPRVVQSGVTPVTDMADGLGDYAPAILDSDRGADDYMVRAGGPTVGAVSAQEPIDPKTAAARGDGQ